MKVKDKFGLFIFGTWVFFILVELVNIVLGFLS